MPTAAENYMEELADKVAQRVLAALRSAPVVTQRLYSVSDVATVIGRTEGAVRQMVAGGKLPNSSPDGRVQVDVQDIEVWIANNKRRK